VFIMAGIGVHDDRNRCSTSVGIGVHLQPEWLFMMGRNTHDAAGTRRASRDTRVAGRAHQRGARLGEQSHGDVTWATPRWLHQAIFSRIMNA